MCRRASTRDGTPLPTQDSQGKPQTLKKYFRVTLPRSDQARSDLLNKLLARNVQVANQASGDTVMMTLTLITIALTVGLFIFFWLSYRRSRDQFMGGGFLSGFSKSTARSVTSRRTRRSRSTTWPAWRASKPTCRRSSSI